MAWLAARFPKWPAIDAALSREDWKLVALLRLSPLVPWNVLNYALSVTGDRANPTLMNPEHNPSHAAAPVAAGALECACLRALRHWWLARASATMRGCNRGLRDAL